MQGNRPGFIDTPDRFLPNRAALRSGRRRPGPGILRGRRPQARRSVAGRDRWLHPYPWKRRCSSPHFSAGAVMMPGRNRVQQPRRRTLVGGGVSPGTCVACAAPAAQVAFRQRPSRNALPLQNDAERGPHSPRSSREVTPRLEMRARESPPWRPSWRRLPWRGSGSRRFLPR